MTLRPSDTKGGSGSQVTQATETPPTPVAHLCDFPECGAFGCYGFRAPGIANLAHRNPAAPQVWVCPVHRDAGEALLQARADEAAKVRVQDLSASARRGEGLLL